MKKYLLDTCALIYVISQNEKGQKIQDLIDAYDVRVSVINFWEIAIKAYKGKLTLSISLKELIEGCKNSLNGVLDIESEDIVSYHKLITQTQHKDPFDLMLLSQAKRGRFSLLTSDSVLLSDFKKLTAKI